MSSEFLRSLLITRYSILCLLCLCGFSSAAEYKLAVPGYQFQFPRDHGSHRAYSTEWWYFTGHLQSQNGRKFGYQLTWFRTAMTPEKIKRQSKWAARDLYFAHFALTDESNGKFYFTDRIERGALKLAGADEAKIGKAPRVWVGSWNLQFARKNGESQTLKASGQSDNKTTEKQIFALDLRQIALKKPVIHGENGVSQKSAGLGRASHYYSFTRLQTSGSLKIGNETLAVSGQSWFDHEFGSNQMDKNQTGWDWFSLQLNDGRELMLYRLRLKNGQIEPLSSGTLVEKNGKTRHLKRSDFRLEPLTNWKSSVSGATYPVKWKISLPREKLILEVAPTVAAQELRPRRSFGINYWEGSVLVSGTQIGHGYVEMTGYDKEFGETF